MDAPALQRRSRKKRSLSVRVSLAIVVVGCILPISAVSAFLIYDYYEREQSRLTADAISRARAMVSAVDRELAIIEASLAVLSSSARLAARDLPHFHEEAVSALRKMSVDSVGLVDASGQLLLSTREPYGTRLPRIANPELLNRIAATGKSGVSDLFVGPLIHKPIVSIGVHVLWNGEFAGTLYATVPPAQIAKLLTEQHLPDSWRAVILDSAGSIVARNHEMDKYVGVKATADLVRRVRLTPEDGFRSTTLDGIPVMTAFSRSPGNGWAVALGMPLAELTFGLYQSLRWLVFAVVLALTAGLALAWIVGGRIARSITALAQPARQLGSGFAVTVPALHFQEAIELADALVDAGIMLEKARHEAHHDALTGLANRTRFDIVVEDQLKMCKRSNREMAVLFIDLDGFKSINDVHGHASGDEVLRAVSQRIRNTLRESDTAARLGGDEFAVCLPETGMAGAQLSAEKLLAALSTAFEVSGAVERVSASIGVAVYPTSARDRDTLLKHADRAMYQAKYQGRNRACYQ